MRNFATPMLLALVLPACSDSPTAVAGGPPGNASGTEVVLAVGQEAQVDPLLVLGVSGVPADSRCALQAMCIWAGEATVAIHHSLGDGPSTSDTVYTTLGRNAVRFGGYWITLLELTPYPVVPTEPRPEEYRAKFRIQPSPE